MKLHKDILRRYCVKTETYIGYFQNTEQNGHLFLCTNDEYKKIFVYVYDVDNPNETGYDFFEDVKNEAESGDPDFAIRWNLYEDFLRKYNNTLNEKENPKLDKSVYDKIAKTIVQENYFGNDNGVQCFLLKITDAEDLVLFRSDSSPKDWYWMFLSTFKRRAEEGDFYQRWELYKKFVEKQRQTEMETKHAPLDKSIYENIETKRRKITKEHFLGVSPDEREMFLLEMTTGKPAIVFRNVNNPKNWFWDLLDNVKNEAQHGDYYQARWNLVKKFLDEREANMNATMETFKSDFKKAGYRTAAIKINRLMRDFIVNNMADRANVKGKKRETFVSNVLPFFESEVGSALISVAVGMVLPNAKAIVPPKYGKHIDLLSEEFRVTGIAMVQGEILDLLTGPGLSMLNSGVMAALDGLANNEESTKIRIVGDDNNNDDNVVPIDGNLKQQAATV